MNAFVRTYRKKNTSFAGLPRRTRGFSGLSSPSVALLPYRPLDRRRTNAFIWHRHEFCWFEPWRPQSQKIFWLPRATSALLRCGYDPDFLPRRNPSLVHAPDGRRNHPPLTRRLRRWLNTDGQCAYPPFGKQRQRSIETKKGAALANSRNAGLRPNDQRAQSPFNRQSQRRAQTGTTKRPEAHQRKDMHISEAPKRPSTTASNQNHPHSGWFALRV